jgi:phage tail sheath gpL-like
MTISFNQIPVTIRVPGVYVEINNSNAVNGVTGLPTKILVIGQRRASGTVQALAPQLITSPDQAAQYFGVDSQLSHMLAALIKGNSFTETWAIALDDNAAGVVATGTLTFTGVPTAAGTLNLYIGGRLVQVAVSVGQTVASIATAVVAAITARTDLAVSANAAAGVVTLTAKHKGECGNFIDLRHSYNRGEALPAGLALAIVAMSGGTGNPLVQAVLDLIGDNWYTDIVTPYTDAINLSAVETKLDTNFGPLKMIDGHAWTAAAGSLATLTTLGLTRNSPHVTCMGVNGSPTPPWEWAACLAGVAAYNLDIDPARPLQTLVLPGLLPPPVANRFTIQERNILLNDHIATYGVDNGGNVLIERAITMYGTNAFGAADVSYLDVETMRTLALLRYDLRTYIARKYPRHKLADDGTNFSRGQAVVTPKVLRGEVIARFKQWESQGWAENVDQFKSDIIVERDANDRNRVNALIPPDIVNQLRVFAGQIDFRL